MVLMSAVNIYTFPLAACYQWYLSVGGVLIRQRNMIYWFGVPIPTIIHSSTLLLAIPLPI